MQNRFSESFDYIVVGAGSAGCAVARRLAEAGSHSVLLVEAGGPDRNMFIHMPVGFIKTLQTPSLSWGYQSEPEPRLNNRVIPIPRGKVLGGSSSINGLFHIRGHAKGFDEWRDLGNDGWGYADVLPYFKRSESNWRGESAYHGGKGPISVKAIDTTKLLFEPLRDAAANAGYPVLDDYDGATQEGFACGEIAATSFGRRASSAQAYLRKNGRPGNLRVQSRVLTNRILLEGSRAVGIECLSDSKLHKIRAEREIILCGGAYNSPQLLMLSGIGPERDLKKVGIKTHLDLPGVGRNLIEHPRLPLRFSATMPVTFTNELRFDRAALSFFNWAVFGKGPFATQISNGTFLFRSDPSQDRPDIQLLCNPIGFDARIWCPGVLPPREHCFYVTVCLVRQKSRGHVTLRSSSPMDAPRIFLNLLSESEDIVALRKGLMEARRIYRTEPQSRLTGKETLPGEHLATEQEIDAAIPDLVGITHHPVGTCKMGQDSMAVVDSQLRVRGIEGLRVADASIMPTIPGANTNAASVMIGEKAADLVLGRSLPPESP